MNRIPNMLSVYNPYRGRGDIYVSISELENWCTDVTKSTPEDHPFHNAAALFNEAIDMITAFFDGSKGTYTDIMTGEVRSYPVICDSFDIRFKLLDEYNSRLIAWPFTARSLKPEEYGDRWYSCLHHFYRAVQRFCKFNEIRYTRLIQTMMIQYNPIADFWEKEKKVGASSPYVSISNNKSSQVGAAENMTIDDWNQDVEHTDGYTVTNQANDEVKNEHFTTTFDDSTTGRLESYDKQTGGTKTTSKSPNSGYFEKREVEGNKGAISPQDAVAREFDIAQLWDIVDLFIEDLSKTVFLQVYEVI